LFIATHVSIRTSDTSSAPYEAPSQAYGTLSYRVSNPLKSLGAWLRPQQQKALPDSRAPRWSQPRPSKLKRRAQKARVTQNDFRWIAHTPSFGYRLEPRTSSAQDDSISELLRFL
jgi:hypothetical protein